MRRGGFSPGTPREEGSRAGLRTKAPGVEERGKEKKGARKGRREAEEYIIGRGGRKHAMNILGPPAPSNCTLSPTSKLARDVQNMH